MPIQLSQVSESRRKLFFLINHVGTGVIKQLHFDEGEPLFPPKEVHHHTRPNRLRSFQEGKAGNIQLNRDFEWLLGHIDSYQSGILHEVHVKKGRPQRIFIEKHEEHPFKMAL